MITQNKSMAKKHIKSRGGFTLIELIVVIAVIAILASVMLPRFTGFTDSARKSAMISDMKNYATGVSALIAQAQVPSANGANVIDYVGNLGGDGVLDFNVNVKTVGDIATSTDVAADNPDKADFKYTKTVNGKVCTGYYDFETGVITVTIS